jgi:hypothetical protein
MRLADGIGSAIKLALACAGLIALAAAANTGGDGTMARTQMAPMDNSVPEKTETATFALG